MSSKKIVAMISVLGDKNGEVTKRLFELVEQGFLPQGVILLDVDGKKSYRDIQKEPQVVPLQKTLTADHVTWPSMGKKLVIHQ